VWKCKAFQASIEKEDARPQILCILYTNKLRKSIGYDYLRIMI